MKRYLFKFSPVFFLFFVVLLSGNFGSAAVPWEYAIPSEEGKPPEITAGKIVADKDSYDGKEVSVSGKISNLKFKASRGAKKYTTFVLVGESGGRINVITSEQPKLKPGQKVRVTGVYRKSKKVGMYTFRNEIEAKKITNP
jgi:hypothetical protein